MTHDGRGRADDASRLAVFTDFDGTLVEIAGTPQAVRLPGELPAEMARAAASLGGAFAVVSGREISDIDRMLFPLVLPVAGSHGAKRRDSSGTEHDLTATYGEAAQRIADALAHFAADHPLLIVEHKAGAAAIHYRRAPRLRDACRAAIAEAVGAEHGFAVLEGKMVFEARPAAIDKGAAVRAFMAEAPFVGCLPVFIGDDTTDEDGFRAVQALGGLGIKVGPGATEAREHLPDVASVHALIRRIAETGTLEESMRKENHA